jgi:hypothetical protein
MFVYHYLWSRHKKRKKKMSKKRFTKIFAGLVLTSAIGLLVLGQVCAAGPAEDSKLKTENSKLENPVPGPNAPASRITASPSTFSQNMPFGEAIDILRYATDPPLNIVVLWRDLSEKADIDKTTPIGMDGVSGIPLRKHLELLLMSVSAGSAAKLGYAVEKGVIIIATTESLPKRAKTRVYDITDLVAEPANYSWRNTMGPMGTYGGSYGNMGYGGYGPGMQGSGYGGAGSYGGAYGAGPYGGGYGNYSSNPYGSGSYGLNRGGSLGNMIGSLYRPAGARYYSGPRSARTRNNSRTAPNR